MMLHPLLMEVDGRTLDWNGMDSFGGPSPNWHLSFGLSDVRNFRGRYMCGPEDFLGWVNWQHDSLLREHLLPKNRTTWTVPSHTSKKESQISTRTLLQSLISLLYWSRNLSTYLPSKIICLLWMCGHFIFGVIYRDGQLWLRLRRLPFRSVQGLSSFNYSSFHLASSDLTKIAIVIARMYRRFVLRLQRWDLIFVHGWVKFLLALA